MLIVCYYYLLTLFSINKVRNSSVNIQRSRQTEEQGDKSDFMALNHLWSDSVWISVILLCPQGKDTCATFSPCPSSLDWWIPVSEISISCPSPYDSCGMELYRTVLLIHLNLVESIKWSFLVSRLRKTASDSFLRQNPLKNHLWKLISTISWSGAHWITGLSFVHKRKLIISLDVDAIELLSYSRIKTFKSRTSISTYAESPRFVPASS